MSKPHSYIEIPLTQAFACLLAIGAIAPAQTQPQDRPVLGKYAQQLATESQALLDSTIRRPYGWASAAPLAEQPELPKQRRQAVVAMGPVESPAAGLLFLWIGDFLNDAVLREAAWQFARGAAAAQERNGIVPRRPLFAANAGAMPNPEYVPRRETTIAALALWLAILQEDASKPEFKTWSSQFRNSAARATTWLEKQQARNGAWPSAHPPDAGAKDAIRILRLDDPNFRDATLALLLASDVGDRSSLVGARRAIDLLVRIRLTYPSRSAALWPIASTIEGATLDSDFQFPAGADVVASRYAVQTLIAASIMLNEDSHSRAIDDASKALSANRFEDGTWPRFFNPGLEPTATTQAARLGATLHSIVDWNSPPGDFGIGNLLAASAKLQTVTRDRYKADLSEYFTARQHLAAAMAGLLDDPLVMQLPADVTSASAYLPQHAIKFKVLEGPQPEDLTSRIHRLWTLLIRAKIERRFGL